VRLAAVALAGAVLLATAPAAAQNYRFPTSSADYPNWYPTAYKDQGGQDWNCGGIYYNGHNGSDFGGGGFPGMEAGRDIVAAADGAVDYVNDGVADDCTSGNCPGGGGFGNYVKLLHADGKATYYGHMRTWSVTVSAGDTVTCGQKIGEMGSSGNSTGPHLHFEPRVDNVAHDPFDGPCSSPPSYWVDQGAHGSLPGLVCDGSVPCAPSGALTCDVPVTASNDDTAGVIGYACTEYTYTGGERAWSFVAAATEEVTVSLTGHTADLDLFVLNGAECTPSDCAAGSTNPNTDAEGLSFNASAGAQYTVIVDGWDGAASSFTLEMDCTAAGDDDDDDDATDDDDVTDDDDSAVTDDDDATDDDDDSAANSSPFFPGATRRSEVGGDEASGGGLGCGGCAHASSGPSGLWTFALFVAATTRRRRAGR